MWELFTIVLIVVVLVKVVWPPLSARYQRWRDPWTAQAPCQEPLLYLTTAMAVRPNVLGHVLPVGYRLSCLYFQAALIDRSNTLPAPFPVTVIDRLQLKQANAGLNATIPDDANLSDLCLARATEILQRARSEDREIRVLWSGGIDSTAAACALLRCADLSSDRLAFYYTRESLREYRAFFKQSLKHLTTVRVNDVGQALDAQALIVTGEMGDQLFGSMRAMDIPWQRLQQPWSRALPEQLNTALASSYRADLVCEYLEPLLNAAPMPLDSLWDALWWINFTAKWQTVMLRIPAQIQKPTRRTGGAPTAEPGLLDQLAVTEHFFRSDDFQIWAMHNRAAVVQPGDWASYKMPLKKFIYAFNEDKKYLQRKLKQPSLYLARRSQLGATASAIAASQVVLAQPLDTSLKEAIHGVESGEVDQQTGVEISFEYEREVSLWKDLTDGE